MRFTGLLLSPPPLDGRPSVPTGATPSRAFPSRTAVPASPRALAPAPSPGANPARPRGLAPSESPLRLTPLPVCRARGSHGLSPPEALHLSTAPPRRMPPREAPHLQRLANPSVTPTPTARATSLLARCGRRLAAPLHPARRLGVRVRPAGSDKARRPVIEPPLPRRRRPWCKRDGRATEATRPKPPCGPPATSHPRAR
jgi:hypothetical protein